MALTSRRILACGVQASGGDLDPRAAFDDKSTKLHPWGGGRKPGSGTPQFVRAEPWSQSFPDSAPDWWDRGAMANVLVVEYERSMHEFLAICLRRDGHQVSVAESGGTRSTGSIRSTWW